MPKLESPVAACLTLMVLASLAFGLSFREGAAAPATDQRQPPLVFVTTATATATAQPTATPPPTATTAASAPPRATPTVVPTATAPAPTPTPTPAASPSVEPSSSPVATPSPASPTAVVAVEWLNLREGPGTEYPVITSLGQGDVLALTGEQHHADTYRWVEVITADGQQGWVIGGAIEMP